MTTTQKQSDPKTGKKTGWIILAAAVLLLSTVMFLVLRRSKPLATAQGYVASHTETAEILDADGQRIRELPRGSSVTYVIEKRKESDPVRIVLDGDSFGYLRAENLTDDLRQVVTVPTVYVRTAVNLADESGAALGTLADKGTALSVLGYDGLCPDGSVVRYRVQLADEEGYLRSSYVTVDEASAASQHDEETYQIHTARGDSWGGGDAAELDYFPREKADFSGQGNMMPTEVKALYLNGESLVNVEDYLAIAASCAINAFVVDVVDGGAVAYGAAAMEKYSPATYRAAINTPEEYRAAVEKLRSAGYYVIGRITTFNDPYLAEDHPECVIAGSDGGPMKIAGMYWPSAYNRFVWQYKVDLAVEAAQTMGFNEIQFDYVRFPDGTWEYDEGEINYRNICGESKAQAIQRFLMYACDRLHDVGVYVSADVFGECAEDYVTAYGQYWPAISTVVDVISAMPYPDHYGQSGDYKPWEHPYETLYTFGTKAAQRQAETASPAVVRTWVQAYNAIREPYNTYGPEQVAQEIAALRDSGNTGGYMTWNAGSFRDKYTSLVSAFD